MPPTTRALSAASGSLTSTILEAVRLRYSLFPYIYTMARKTYDTGISICRPLYYEYPDVEEAYTYDNEYFFGDDILVAPITEAPKEACNKDPENHLVPRRENGGACLQTSLLKRPCKKTMQFTDAQIPYFFRQGAIIPYNPATVMNVTERPDKLILNVVAGSNGEDRSMRMTATTPTTFQTAPSQRSRRRSAATRLPSPSLPATALPPRLRRSVLMRFACATAASRSR